MFFSILQVPKTLLTFPFFRWLWPTFYFSSLVAEHATGDTFESGVHAVILQWVRRSGRSGGTEAEQKEWKLACSLGSKIFILAFFQKASLQHSTAPKVTSWLSWWLTCRRAVMETWKLIPFEISYYLVCCIFCKDSVDLLSWDEQISWSFDPGQ